MKIYIAGAWVEQHTRARPMIAAVRAAGLVVTCDWTTGTTIEMKMRLADATRATDRARTKVHVALNSLYCAKVDVAHARSTLTRCREEETVARRALRAAERRKGTR